MTRLYLLYNLSWDRLIVVVLEFTLASEDDAHLLHLLWPLPVHCPSILLHFMLPVNMDAFQGKDLF